MTAFRIRRIARRALRPALLAGVAVLLFVPVRALIAPASPDPGIPGVTATVPDDAGHPKIQSALTRLAAIARVQGREAAGLYALQRKMDWRDGSIRVVSVVNNIGGARITARTSAAVRVRVESLGGRVETTYRDLVQHTIPLSALETLADDPLIKYIRSPLKPFKQAVVSEGVAKTGADLWKSLAPFKNDVQAKVCILDAGFDGYLNLLGKELPKTVTARSFRADGDITGGGESHGAACAEIVYDMAPNAKMYLANFETDVEQHNAVDWIVSQKVDVISCSLGWFNAGAGDGTGPIDDDPAYASSHGIAWANSAGNSAQDHWFGIFSDPDGNGYMNFENGTEMLTFDSLAYDTTGVFLNWKDWGTYDGFDYSGSAEDYDLELYHQSGATWQFVDSSTNRQTGSQWPVEEIYGWYSRTDGVWGLKIRKIRASKNVDLEIVTLGNYHALQNYKSSYSVLVPADSPYALAAGATRVGNDVVEYFSGRGPTWDGRLKPDLTAPDGVSTETYGDYNFYGTSASAPHLAGAIALLKGMTPYTIAQIKTLLIKRAIDLGNPGPDYDYGYGRLNVKK
jgi:hypothetical protein